MNFKEKYTNEKDNEAGKTKLSNEAYAIGEMLDELLKQLKRVSKNGRSRNFMH